MSGKRIARIHLSDEALLTALYLPEDTQILAVLEDDWLDPLSTTLVVSHQDLPEVAEGVMAPVSNPVYEVYDYGSIRFVDWGVK